MKPPETIDTARLLLRKPSQVDAQELFAGHVTDPMVTKYLSWKPHTDIEMTRSYLRRCINSWQEEEAAAFPWVIVLKSEDRLIGTLEMRVLLFRADLGYALSRPYWGKGYATEAAQAVVDWAMAQPELYRVWAVCDVDNHASARVLEKAGMQCEGILRRFIVHPNISSEPRDCYCYSIVK